MIRIPCTAKVYSVNPTKNIKSRRLEPGSCRDVGIWTLNCVGGAYARLSELQYRWRVANTSVPTKTVGKNDL
eukprot:1074408-Rhodomonas_salina.1